MYKKNSLGKKYLVTAVACCGFIAGVAQAAVNCKSNNCRPASIADVKSLIAQSFAPVPGDVLEYSPVQIIATRTCNLTPDDPRGTASFTLRSDTISITSQVTNAANPASYTLACANPTTATVKLYRSRSGASTVSTYPITYAAPGALTAPTTTLATDVLTTIDPTAQTTTDSGFSAGLNSTFVVCTLTDTANTLTWTIPVSVSYCD